MSKNIQPETQKHKGKEVYLEAGADYVIDSLEELKDLIEKIYRRLACGERP